VRRRGEIVKIGDVAAAAGVSPATVSRVLNGTGRVSAERAELVREAAARLGYEPFGPARALRQQLTRVWAVIVADIENPFFPSMVRGAEDVARLEGHRLVLGNSDEDLDKEASYIDIAIAERMAGVIIAVASTTESDLEPLLTRGIPVVAVDRRPRHHEVDSVLVDNRLGADEATQHLLEGGSTRIACITGPSRLSTATERLQGYRDALARNRLPADRSMVRRADFRQMGGYKAALSLLGSDNPPDALFVANNLMTVGAIHAIRDTGGRIPDDVAVVGFDDQPWTTLTSPQLTVVAQPTYEIGQEAAQLLSTASTADGSRSIVLKPRLLVRESSVR
jgi:LacI family transcriptional regulator